MMRPFFALTLNGFREARRNRVITDAPEPGGLTGSQMLRACELLGARKPAVMDIVELIPAYDHPSFISMRLACYMILHVLGGMATGGHQVTSP